MRGRTVSGGGRAIVLIAAALLPLALAAPAAAGDPDLEWRTIETPHFRINFPDSLERLARRAARHLEHAHRVLVPLLDHEPEGVTEVVITDTVDSANGSSTALPFKILRLFAIPPFDLSPLQSYDDWLWGLIVHEYTHLLHLDNMGGIATVVNGIFGRVWYPNHANPRFVVEGYAVYQETTRTGRGRLRSTLWEMYLRQAFLAGEELRLDQVTHGVRGWPHGEIPYLYGAYLIDYVVSRHGPEVLGEMATDYGSDLLPFGTNYMLEDATGEDWVEVYDGWRVETRERFERQRAALEADGLVEGTRILTDAESVRTPRWRPDGRTLGVFAYTGTEQPSLYLLDPETGDRETLVQVDGHGALSWAPDGEGFVFHESEIYRNFYAFYDLFARQPDGEVVRLTEGLRARDPDLNAAGTRVACVLGSPYGSSLATLAPDGTGLEIRLAGAEETQIYTPRWSPDGRRLAFSAWLPGGDRDLFVLDLAGGELVRLTHDRAIDAAPAWTPDGERLVFSSDRTGIANLYALEIATGRTWRITNTVGGAFQPDVSRDGTRLAFVGYAHTGYDLRVLDFDPAAWVEVEGSSPEAVEELAGVRDPNWDPAPGVPRSRPYDPTQTVAPRAWNLELATSGEQPVLGIRVQGNDVANYHLLVGLLSIGLERGNVDFSASYSYFGWNPSLALTAWHGSYPRRDLRVDGENQPWTQEAYGARADVVLSWLDEDWQQFFTLQYRLEHSEPGAGDFQWPLDPNMESPDLPFTGLFSGFTLSWYLSTLKGTTYDFGRDQGFTLGLDVTVADPALGGDRRLLEFRAGGVAFLAAPWAETHAFAFRLAGGMGRSDGRGGGLFFLGGFPEQDYVRGILYAESVGSVALRGYPPWSVYGSRYVQADLEYRFPIVDADVGLWTLPAFLRRLSANLFCDIAAAAFRELLPEDVKVGLGAELFAQFSLGWYLEPILRVGYAYGFMEPGEHDVYVTMGLPF